MTCFASCVCVFAALTIQYSVASTPAMRLPPKQSCWQQTLAWVINSSGDSETGFEFELCAPRAAAALASFNGLPYKKFVDTNCRRDAVHAFFSEDGVYFHERPYIGRTRALPC